MVGRFDFEDCDWVDKREWPSVEGIHYTHTSTLFTCAQPVSAVRPADSGKEKPCPLYHLSHFHFRSAHTTTPSLPRNLLFPLPLTYYSK